VDIYLPKQCKMSLAKPRGGYTHNSARGGPQVINTYFKAILDKNFLLLPKRLAQTVLLVQITCNILPTWAVGRGSKRRQVERNMLQGVVF